MLLFCVISNSDVADVVSILNWLSRDPPSEYHTHMHISVGPFSANFYNDRHVRAALPRKERRPSAREGTNKRHKLRHFCAMFMQETGMCSSVPCFLLTAV